MKLEEWMEREKLSVSELARKAGILPGCLRRFLRGSAYLHPKNEQAIVAFTGGKVGYADLRPYIKAARKGQAA